MDSTDYRIVVTDNTIILHYHCSQCAGLITFHQLDKNVIDQNLLVIASIKANVKTNAPITFAETATAVGQLYYEDNRFIVQETFSSTYLPNFLTMPIFIILDVINLHSNQQATNFMNDISALINRQMYTQAFNQFRATLVDGKIVKS